MSQLAQACSCKIPSPCSTGAYRIGASHASPKLDIVQSAPPRPGPDRPRLHGQSKVTHPTYGSVTGQTEGLGLSPFTSADLKANAVPAFQPSRSPHTPRRQWEQGPGPVCGAVLGIAGVRDDTHLPESPPKGNSSLTTGSGSGVATHELHGGGKRGGEVVV